MGYLSLGKKVIYKGISVPIFRIILPQTQKKKKKKKRKEKKEKKRKKE